MVDRAETLVAVVQRGNPLFCGADADNPADDQAERQRQQNIAAVVCKKVPQRGAQRILP